MPRRANGQTQIVRRNRFPTALLPYLLTSFCLASCSRSSHNDPSTLTFLIESSPTHLDPRFATDSQSQRIDALTDQIRVEMNQEKREALCSEVQTILANDLPYLPLWFNDVVSVHDRSLGELNLSSTGDYNFLTTLRPSDK